MTVATEFRRSKDDQVSFYRFRWLWLFMHTLPQRLVEQLTTFILLSKVVRRTVVYYSTILTQADGVNYRAITAHWISRSKMHSLLLSASNVIGTFYAIELFDIGKKIVPRMEGPSVGPTGISRDHEMACFKQWEREEKILYARIGICCLQAIQHGWTLESILITVSFNESAIAQ